MNKTTERALLARPLALCLGATAVVWLNPNLRGDTLFLWLAVIFGGPTLLLWVARELRTIARIAPVASPVISLLGWGALATFTLGLKSPILAAFFFEVALAAVSMGPKGVVVVTSVAVAVLAIVQFLFGFAAGWQLLLLEAGFLVVMGGLGFAMANRRVASEAALRVQSDELGRRLEALQRQLEDARVVSRVGENVARLAHGLKNAVHSLRGFVGLIEPEAERGGASREALAGLRAAIDDLERLARLTLAESSASPDTPRGADRAGRPSSPTASVPARGARSSGRRALVAEVLEAAARDLSPLHPEVVFDLQFAPEVRSLVVPLDPTPLQELLTILLRNAVEAMRGVGCCTVEVRRQGARCHVAISDEGEGLTPDALERIFTPGFTTKAGGSGFGLFLARRISEDLGGTLSLTAGAEKGAVARLELPLAPVDATGAGDDGDIATPLAAQRGGRGRE